jgi:hypothetical protein
MATQLNRSQRRSDERKKKIHETALGLREHAIEQLGRVPLDLVFALQQATADVCNLYFPPEQHKAVVKECIDILEEFLKQENFERGFDRTCVLCGKTFTNGDLMRKVFNDDGLPRMAHVACFNAHTSD